MPPGEIAPFRDQPVGARRRQPAERPDLGRGQFDAIMHPAAAVRIIGAAAGAWVKELAADVGEVNFAALLVFKLDKAAAAASVAETFPFRRVECFERFSLPKW